MKTIDSIKTYIESLKDNDKRTVNLYINGEKVDLDADDISDISWSANYTITSHLKEFKEKGYDDVEKAQIARFISDLINEVEK